MRTSRFTSRLQGEPTTGTAASEPLKSENQLVRLALVQGSGADYHKPLGAVIRPSGRAKASRPASLQRNGRPLSFLLVEETGCSAYAVFEFIRYIIKYETAFHSRPPNMTTESTTGADKRLNEHDFPVWKESFCDVTRRGMVDDDLNAGFNVPLLITMCAGTGIFLGLLSVWLTA